MTEVMPENPMKIQAEEIKVDDGFEHVIKILDISEQIVNIMKEWMAFQGFEDIHQILGSLYRDPWTNMNHPSTQRGNKPFFLNMWHPTFPCSLTGTGNSPATTKCQHQWLLGST